MSRSSYLAIAFALAIILPATGCTVHRGGDATRAGRLDVGGRARSYLLHVPPQLTTPVALVVNLHGGGGQGRSAEGLSSYDAVADAHGFLVVYPDGIDENWADGRGASRPDRDHVDD